MGWIDTLFGGGREQAGKDMQNQLNQGWDYSKNAMNPYMGDQSQIRQEYLNAIRQGQDPVSFFNSISSQYQMSPFAQAQLKEAQQGANQASAASGMLGSGAEQKAAADRATSVRSNDFQSWINNIMGIRNQYLGGLGGLESQGFQGSEYEAQMAQKHYQDMADAQAGEDMGRAGGWSNFLGGVAGAVSNHFLPGSGGWAKHIFGGGGDSDPGYDDGQDDAYGRMPSSDGYNQYL